MAELQLTWIDAEAEKPDADQIVLIHTAESSEPVWLGYWDDEQSQWYFEDGGRCEPTHWMQLPEPPQSHCNSCGCLLSGFEVSMGLCGDHQFGNNEWVEDRHES